MATTKPKFAGWTFFFDEPALEKGARRSRRSTASDSKLILRRDEDGLEIKGGDSILLNDPEGGAPIVCLIRDAQIGNDDYIVLRGLNYLRRNEVVNEPQGTHPQELFLTSVQDQLYVEDIIEKAQVLNEEEFNSIVIDDSNQDNTFLCRRGYDTYYNVYSHLVDIKAIRAGMFKDPDAEVEVLRRSFVKSLYSERLPSPSIKKEPSSKKSSASPGVAHRKKSSRKPTPKVEKVPKVTNRGRLIEHVVSDFEDDDNDNVDGVEVTDGSQPNTVNASKKKANLFVSNDEDEIESASRSGSSEIDDESESESESEDDFLSDDDEFRPKKRVARGKYNKSKKKQKLFTSLPSSSKTKETKTLSSLLNQDNNNLQNGNDDDKPAFQKLKKRLNASAESSLASLPCREEEFSQLYLIIESAIEFETGTCVYISGTPGTGKTATVREVIRQLSKQASKTGQNQFHYLEINGMKLLSPQSSFELLWKKLRGDKIATSSNIQKELDDYFIQGKSERPLVVLMDELDQIATKNQNVMYNFFNWPTYQKSKLIVIAVANTMDLPERVLTNKISSRLGLSRIQFPGYTHEDLKKIISARLEIFQDTEVELHRDAIEFAARKVASVSGDARRALKICRRAVELAEADYLASGSNESKMRVQISHISKAINETTNSPVSNYITGLSFVGKLLLTAILSRKRKSGLAENSLGDVIDEVKQIVTMNSAKDQSKFIIENKTLLDILYEDFIVRPKGFAYVLNELIEAGLILQQNLKSERTSLIKLNVSDEEITSVFKKEKSLQYIMPDFTE